jgi:hypothetical protein
MTGTGRWDAGAILAAVDEVRTRTLTLPDGRGGDRFLRVTWHPTTATVVFSHWTGSLCTASTPMSLAEDRGSSSCLSEPFVASPTRR